MPSGRNHKLSHILRKSEAAIAVKESLGLGDAFEEFSVKHLVSSMAQERRVVIGGVDTNKDVHVAAVIDERGKILDMAEFEATAKGYRLLVEWMRSFGELAKVGVEGNGTPTKCCTVRLNSPWLLPATRSPF